MTVNTREYWAERFCFDWEAKQGREQTRFFARLALRHLPDAVVEDIRAGALSICDFGCALGDALPVLAQAFPGSAVCGVDFASPAVEPARVLYPDHEFYQSSAMSEVPRPFDVIYCSNTLEHFADPSTPLLDLARAARRYLLVLVPFRERERIAEHFVSFDFPSFPIRIGPLNLAAFREFDASTETPSYWPGRQILVVYAHPDAAGTQRLLLSDLTAELVSQLDAACRERDAIAAANAKTTERLHRVAEDAAELARRLDRSHAEAAELRSSLDRSHAEAAKLLSRFEEANAALSRIYESDFWQLASTYYRWRDRIGIAKYAHSAVRATRRLRGHTRPATDLSVSPGEPRGQTASVRGLRATIPHSGVELLKPIDVTVTDTDFDAAASGIPFSLVTTIKNERSGIVDFLASIERQSVKPDEVIVVDGGSTDGTVEAVEEFRRGSSLDLRFIQSPGANIAEGRNCGIRAARNDLLVLTDGGCRLDEHFCKNLVGCFTLGYRRRPRERHLSADECIRPLSPHGLGDGRMVELLAVGALARDPEASRPPDRRIPGVSPAHRRGHALRRELPARLASMGVQQEVAHLLGRTRDRGRGAARRASLRQGRRGERDR